jgi:phosphoglycerate dehydrogenase-like enzyme
MANVIVTSHHSAAGVDYLEGLYRLFAENLRRLRDGREPLNLVDKARGY